jgi:hypothetical protein
LPKQSGGSADDGVPSPKQGIALTHFGVSDHVERSRASYTDALGGETVIEGEPRIVTLANGWVMINVSGVQPTTSRESAATCAPPTGASSSLAASASHRSRQQPRSRPLHGRPGSPPRDDRNGRAAGVCPDAIGTLASAAIVEKRWRPAPSDSLTGCGSTGGCTGLCVVGGEPVVHGKEGRCPCR